MMTIFNRFNKAIGVIGAALGFMPRASQQPKQQSKVPQSEGVPKEFVRGPQLDMNFSFFGLRRVGRCWQYTKHGFAPLSGPCPTKGGAERARMRWLSDAS